MAENNPGAASTAPAPTPTAASSTPPTPTLKVSPPAIELSAGDAQPFFVEPSSLAVTWEVIPRDVGVIQDGVYVAPPKVPNPRSVVVLARTGDRGQYGVATVSLSDDLQQIRLLGYYGLAVAVLLGVAMLLFWSLLDRAPRETMVVVNPPFVTLDSKRNEMIQFAATIVGKANHAVIWTATEGKMIDSNGVYRHSEQKDAKETKSFKVRATSSVDQSSFGEAIVNLVPDRRLLVFPSGVSAFTSEQIPFRAEGTDPLNIEWNITRTDLGVFSPTDASFYVAGHIRRIEPVQVTARDKTDKTRAVFAAAVIIVTPPFAERSYLDWRTLFFVMVMGALGSMIYFSSSFVNYVGNRTFRSSWFWFYISRPFVGGALAVIFFFIVGSGLISGTSPTDLMTIAMIAALVGLFSDKAVRKLSDILDTLLMAKEDRQDKLDTRSPTTSTSIPQGAAAPTIKTSDPVTVKQGQAATVKVFGSNFNNFTVKVNDGPEIQPKEPAQDSFKIDLTAEDTKGKSVLITVINGDKTRATLELKTSP
jgi:hypothetical protein